MASRRTASAYNGSLPATFCRGTRMKLVRYGPPGREKPGMIDAEGNVRDLSQKIRDIDAGTLNPASMERLAGIDARQLPQVDRGVRLGPCVATPSKFLAIGLNYVDHAKETGLPI